MIIPSQLIYLLFSRLVLFFFAQVVVSIILFILGFKNAWIESANWWPISAIFANIVCVIILSRYLKFEGKKYSNIIKFDRAFIKSDVGVMLLITLVALPLAYIPNTVLATKLFGTMDVAVNLLYRPLPFWAAVIALVFFPLSQVFGELPLYFGYILPRLKKLLKNKLLAIILPAIALSVQHIAIPVVFRLDFIIWRGLMFLPFAILLALVVNWRPRLLPYFLIGHFILNLMNGYMFIVFSAQ